MPTDIFVENLIVSDIFVKNLIASHFYLKYFLLLTVILAVFSCKVNFLISDNYNISKTKIFGAPPSSTPGGGGR